MLDINQFIKKLKVLYVEDEDTARNMFGKYLNKKFDTTITCENGLNAFLEFDKANLEKKPFDLIISDINMPKMDGLELLEKIREKDSNIPFMFTTARSESEQMVKAINLGVNYYLLKPLDIDAIENSIQKLCKEIYYKKNYELQKRESEALLSLLNKEAIVSKTDLEGNITYVNDAFLEVSGYTEEEVIGKNHNILKHPDNPISLYKDMWDTITNGKSWEGTLKNLSREKETYYINTKIMPLFDETGKNITEYISIRFLVTEEENQKREHNRRFLERISTYKKEIAKLKKEESLGNDKVNKILENNSFLKEKNITYENKIKNLLTQLAAYETNSLEISKVELMMKQDKTKQFELINKELHKNRTLNKNLLKELETLKKLLRDKEHQIDELEQKKLDYEKRIENLLDLVNNLQEEVKELKGEEQEE